MELCQLEPVGDSAAPILPPMALKVTLKAAQLPFITLPVTIKIRSRQHGDQEA